MLNNAVLEGVTTMLGEGTSTNPYQIRTPAQLYQLQQWVSVNNSTYIDKFYIQTAYLDLSAYSNWTPIGTNLYNFSGTYDGNGLGIYNLNCSTTKAGLFGYINNATLKNIAIISGSISASGASAYCGAVIASSNDSNITGCVVYGNTTVTNTGSSSSCFCGGIIGYFTRTFKTVYCNDCYNAGTVRANQTTTGAKFGGGIIGYTSDSVNFVKTRLFNSGNVTRSGTATIGAICGIGSSTLSYYDSGTSGATSSATARSTENCKGADVLTNSDKLSGLSETYWKQHGTDYPLPIRFL